MEGSGGTLENRCFTDIISKLIFQQLCTFFSILGQCYSLVFQKSVADFLFYDNSLFWKFEFNWRNTKKILMVSKVSLSDGPKFEEKLSKVFQISSIIHPSYVSTWWPLSKITHHLH